MPLSNIYKSKYTGSALDAKLDAALLNNGSQVLTGDLTIKKEGAATGNVVVQGNLTVNGSTITKDTETLAVKDNLIVTNSDGAELSNLSGLVIKTGEASAYAIVYDPTEEAVKLGLGTIGEDNEFTFDEGDGDAVAVRSQTFTDAHIAVWDATNHKFIDGGTTVAALNASIAEAKSAGDNAQSAVDAIEAKVVQVDDGETSTLGAYANPIASKAYVDTKMTTSGMITSVGLAVSETAGHVGELALSVNGAEEDYVPYVAPTTVEGINTRLTTAEGEIDDLQEAVAGVITSGDVDEKISAHNTSGSAHADIRQLITNLGKPVKSVTLASGDSNGTVKLTVDGSVSNVAVTGLQDAAFTTVENILAQVPEVEPASSTTAGIVKLGAAGGAATYESVQAINGRLTTAEGEIDAAQEDITELTSTVNGKYTKPTGGIPLTDLAAAVQASIAKADTAWQPVDASATTKGIALLGAAGGAATYEALTALTARVAALEALLSVDGYDIFLVPKEKA